MGKRGPQPGAAERKRARIPRRVVIVSDHELVEAQHLNDRLEAFLEHIEQRRFPLTLVDAELVDEVVDSTALLQGVIVDGIADRLLREAAPAERGDDEPSVMRGTYEIGRKRGR